MRNRYPGICYQCGEPVKAFDGHFERYKRKWRVQHASCCLKNKKRKKEMALDIRLDFIENINQTEIDRMTEIRKKFIELDQELQQIADDLNNNPAGLRATACARTNLEIGLQYAIKSLCLLGEVK